MMTSADAKVIAAAISAQVSVPKRYQITVFPISALVHILDPRDMPTTTPRCWSRSTWGHSRHHEPGELFLWNLCEFCARAERSRGMPRSVSVVKCVVADDTLFGGGADVG
jgi:hypothetical protein